MATCLADIVSKICSTHGPVAVSSVCPGRTVKKEFEGRGGDESSTRSDDDSCHKSCSSTSPARCEGNEPAWPRPMKRPVRTDPIVLDTLQGDWFTSGGAKITVTGIKVKLNGHLMEVHPVQLNDDGTVKCIGSIWQLWGWAPDDKIEFKEAPNHEAGRFARSVFWNKMEGEESRTAWETHMTNLGYAGSALGDLSKRGVEGCRPGSCDAYSAPKDEIGEDEIHQLSKAIKEWRIEGLHPVKPELTIPDFSNRCHTGISVEHMHYLAKSFMDKGFQKRDNASHKGHDMPVVVMEKPTTEWGQKSIDNWRSKVEEDAGFPPMAHYAKTFCAPRLYTTLGNGHFFQALNLVSNECQTINDKGQGKKYSIGNDAPLREAIYDGVPSIVLKTETPMEVRQFISRVLNSKHDFRWKISRKGSFLGVEEDTSKVSQFVAMSKVLDAVELDCLVRVELGVSDSRRVGK